MVVIGKMSGTFTHKAPLVNNLVQNWYQNHWGWICGKYLKDWPLSLL